MATVQLALLLVALLGQVVRATPCTVVVPQDPLTATGLATPYILQTGCSMAVPGQEVFVEGAVYDPNTNTVSIYNPLVIDQGTQPAVQPVVPNLPVGATVGLWFGTNAGALTLTGDLAGGNCVNGLVNKGVTDIFGQFAYCNAPTFFAMAANVQVPALGTASDGLPCLTTRDFALVDMDQSDNVNTKYILTTTKTTAQNTAVNRAKLQVATILENGSDNALLAFMDQLMGCTPFLGRDLADVSETSFIPSLALNELAAAKQQAAPVAIVPDNDPMAVVNGVPNVVKLNLYRVGVNQPVAVASPAVDYCRNYAAIQPPRLLANQNLLLGAKSLAADTGDSMFTFLAARFVNSFGADGLNCVGLGFTSPITVQLDANGVAVAAQINAQPATANNNNNNIDTAAIAGGVGGGLGGLLVLGGAFVALRRRSRRSWDRGTTTKVQSPNQGGGGFGGGFTASFNNFRQSFMPSPGQWGQSIRQSFMPAQWGQNIRQSVMNFGGYGKSRPSAAPGMTSPMSSNPQFSPPSQYGNTPSPYGAPSPYGGAPSPYGGANPYGNPYQSAQKPYGGPPGPSASAPKPYGGPPGPSASAPRPYGTTPTYGNTPASSFRLPPMGGSYNPRGYPQ